MRFEAFNPTDGFPDSYSNNASTLGHLQQIHIPSIEHTNIQKEIIAEEQAYDKLVNILNTSQLSAQNKPQEHSAVLETFVQNCDPDLSAYELTELHYLEDVNVSPTKYSIGIMLSKIANNNDRVIALKALAEILPKLKTSIMFLGDLDDCAEEANYYQQLINERSSADNMGNTAVEEGRIFAVSSTVDSYVNKWIDGSIEFRQQFSKDILQCILKFEDKTSEMLEETYRIEPSATSPIVYSAINGLKKKYF
ncbi:hypothetical protein KA043_00060 [Candidatus Saccharibacteria bacterium]|jgi:hypothetical protein|nr:hypothetical protein [Candidatus Saccharibacteria bacterium]